MSQGNLFAAYMNADYPFDWQALSNRTFLQIKNLSNRILKSLTDMHCILKSVDMLKLWKFKLKLVDITAGS